jgi:hypothetical protein
LKRGFELGELILTKQMPVTIKAIFH